MTAQQKSRRTAVLPDMAASKWRYWTAVKDLPVELVFRSDERLRRLEGKPAAVRVIEFQP